MTPGRTFPPDKNKRKSDDLCVDSTAVSQPAPLWEPSTRAQHSASVVARYCIMKVAVDEMPSAHLLQSQHTRTALYHGDNLH